MFARTISAAQMSKRAIPFVRSMSTGFPSVLAKVANARVAQRSLGGFGSTPRQGFRVFLRRNSDKAKQGAEAEAGAGKEQTGVTVVSDSYSEVDIARSLPTYGPAATAGYSVLTAGMLCFAISAAGYLFMEIFSSSGPQRCMDASLSLVRENKVVEQLLGTPIEGFGQTSGRGRARRISSESYEMEMPDGSKKPMMAVQYYVKGPKGQGTVTAQAELTKGFLGFGGGQEITRCWMIRTHQGHQPARTRYRVDVVAAQSKVPAQDAPPKSAE